MAAEERTVNEGLREIHLAHLNGHPDAIRLYDQLVAVVAERPEGIDDAAQHLVWQIAELQILRVMARDDIREYGLRKPFSNGRQKMDVDNKSIGTLQRCIEEQRKLMAELQITPASRKATQLSMFGDDGFDDF